MKLSTLLLLCGAVWSVAGFCEVGKVNYVKYFKLYIKNTITGDIQACFPRDFSSTLPSEAGYNARDGTNFASGYTNGKLMDVFGCPNSGDQCNTGAEAWGCTLPIVKGNFDIYQFRVKLVMCDADFVPSTAFRWNFYEETGFEAFTLLGNTDFDAVVMPGFTAPAGPFIYDGESYLHYETDYFPGLLGPSMSDDIGMAELVITLDDVNGVAPSAAFLTRLRVPHWNPCAEATRCSTALLNLATADLEPPAHLCPAPHCPPTWHLYSQDICYQTLITSGNNPVPHPTQPQSPVMSTILGIRECTSRGIPTDYCHMLINEMNVACERFANQDFNF